MGEIFITRRIFSEATDILKKAGHEVDINDSSNILSKTELIKNAQGMEGLVCLLNDKIDEDVLDPCSSLKVISNVAVGYDNIDIEAATRRGIMVTNTPGVLTDTTADLVFALLLGAARRIPEADRYSREGKYNRWELVQPHTGVDVYGKTLGVVGMGRIGEAVAKRGRRGFEMEVLYYDIEPRKEVEEELGAEHVEFDELLEKSDFISIHAPLTDMTEGMFGSEEFGKMKKDAILINAARGPIVDEDSLAEAIGGGEILGTAIDTFEKEPKVNSKLAEIEEHTVLTPHIGSASRETRKKMANIASKNMVSGLEGDKPPNIINEEVFGLTSG